MKRTFWAFLFFAASSCTVEKTAPLTPGSGLDIDAGTISVNASEVPIVTGACSEGQVIARTATGWECRFAAGATGDQGATGATGTQGASGPTGEQGEVGSTGAVGPTSDPGATGPQGVTGPTGDAQWVLGASGAINYAGGNVGIGTTEHDALLDVTGNVRVGAPSVGRTVELSYSSAPDYGSLIYMTLDVSPMQKAIRLRTSYDDVGTQSTANFSIDRSINAQNYGLHPSTLTYAPSLVIDGSNGNVGIGTTRPGSLLDVIGESPANYIAQFLNTSATGHGLTVLAGTASDPHTSFSVKDKDGTNLFWIRSDGAVWYNGGVQSTRASKREIQAFDERAFNLLENIEIVTFNYREDPSERTRRIGFIAADPDHRYDVRLTNSGQGFDTTSIVAVLIKATQEQQGQIRTLEQRLERLENNAGQASNGPRPIGAWMILGLAGLGAGLALGRRRRSAARTKF